MIILKFDRDTKPEWWSYKDSIADKKRILSRYGYTASEQDIYDAWIAFSDSMAAGWMYQGGGDYETCQTLLQYLKSE